MKRHRAWFRLSSDGFHREGSSGAELASEAYHVAIDDSLVRCSDMRRSSSARRIGRREASDLPIIVIAFLENEQLVVGLRGTLSSSERNHKTSRVRPDKG